MMWFVLVAALAQEAVSVPPRLIVSVVDPQPGWVNGKTELDVALWRQAEPHLGAPEFSDVHGGVTVVNRASLKTGQQIKGPSLITETSSTTWLAEGWSATVDKVGSLALCRD